MKYGQRIEKESVPEWSLHNIDYNSLKHHIKLHTARDQASAISIPGQQDTALREFENELFLELCRQHDRVDLFVSSKANELSRRLQSLSESIHKLLTRCALSQNQPSAKVRRRFARYEQDLENCSDDIEALDRFVNAQVVGFRKILKKYRKWTGSNSLGNRFKDTVLSHPKSFTRRDFAYLQSQCDSLLAILRAATPTARSDTSTTDGPHPPRAHSLDHPKPTSAPTSNTHGDGQEQFQLRLPEPAVPPQGYWNEYDNGSEAGDNDGRGNDGYALYVNPDESAFPGWAALSSLWRIPLDKTRAWFSHGQAEMPNISGASNTDTNNNLDSNSGTLTPENAPLLMASSASSYGTTHTHMNTPSAYTSPTVNSSSYHTTPPFGGSSLLSSDTDDDQPFKPSFADRHLRPKPSKARSAWSDDHQFPSGYATHYATTLPSVEEQRVAKYRERVLLYGTLGAFTGAFVILTVAAVLMFTGRHRLRVEVDVGVTIGVCASLTCACAALGMNMNRRESGGWANWLLVSGAFAAVCLLDGGLLVMVVGNTAL